MTISELKHLLANFLERWTVAEIKKMQLTDYVGIGNKDTFCQWVETKTRMLGSIKGMTSIKFGIYERNDPSVKPQNYQNDEKYSWLAAYGNDREEAFKRIKEEIIEIVNLSEIGKFHLIDNIKLPDLYKWKVAFLYSNERLIPFFKRDALLKVAEHFGLQTSSNTKVSEIQNLMMVNKPANLNVYEFMRMLDRQFNKVETEDDSEAFEIPNEKQNRILRKAAIGRDTTQQIRTITTSFVVEQKHNKIQEELKRLLIEEYGQSNVILEENYVDVKLLQPDSISFYEVKSSSYASECIKEALGQILLYSFNDTDKRSKKHFVVGQYPPTENDKKYIAFLKENLNLEFDYISVAIK
jgi:cellobiose-specific phosphotransferase system component IIB